jgi:Peptidase family M48
VTVGLGLFSYAALLSVLGSCGPFGRGRRGWLARSPRLGATLLLAAAWSTLTALFLAGLTMALPATALSSGLSDVLGACIVRLRAAYATPGGAAVAGAGLTLSAAIVVRIAWASLQVSRARRTERRRQRTLIALCGRTATDLGAVVLDQAEPAAYCLAGADRTVVLTRGALELLSRPQLDAVLAHEQAHLRARHHRLIALASVAARTLPELPVLRDLADQVRGLLEMDADDRAAGAHDPEDLATALVAVAGARPRRSAGAGFTTALAVGEGDTVGRIRRLLGPPQALSPRRRHTVRGAVAALGVVPLLIAVTPAAVAANQPPVRATVSTSSAHR